jgi:hypothetical protein
MEYMSQAATKAGKEGTPAFAAALKLLMGTAPGANAALATTGANFQATAAGITAVSRATADAQGKVRGFALVQQNLGQQLKDLKAGFDSVMIRIGDGLIPMLSSLISLVESKVTPAIHGLSDAVKGIAQGFQNVFPASAAKSLTKALSPSQVANSMLGGAGASPMAPAGSQNAPRLHR